MSVINFKKYQGLGNDFIVIDCRDSTLTKNIFYSDKQFVKKVCDRNFGIGADGLILALNSSLYDFRMKYFNSDGSEGEMCGNGIRCLTKFVSDLNLSNSGKSDYLIETLAGTIACSLQGDNIKVNMGKPIFKKDLIPTKFDYSSEKIATGMIHIDGNEFTVYSVGMGNPHAIIIVEDLSQVILENWGPIIENNVHFPMKTNVHFVKVHNENLLELLIWERGCGPTLACGTGACASLAIVSSLNMCKSQATVILPGGNLFISWPSKSGDLYMTGPASYVYRGTINI